MGKTYKDKKQKEKPYPERDKAWKEKKHELNERDAEERIKEWNVYTRVYNNKE